MRIFGLIGYPLEHSFSRKYFTEKFQSEGKTDCIYKNFPIENINELPGLVESHRLSGLNITIPYKEKVLPFLKETDDTVKALGACNCIKVSKEGQLKGFNTDVAGFRISLKKHLNPNHKNALILGEGGAAKAVRFVLEELGINYLTVSRRNTSASGVVQYNELNDEVIAKHKLIINSTPLGMFPNIKDCPHIPYAAIGSGHYLYDLIYNPEKTEFLKRGEDNGAVISNGYDMLIIQAEESWRIWNDETL